MATHLKALSGIISALHFEPHWLKKGESYAVTALDVRIAEENADDVRIQGMWHDGQFGSKMQYATATGKVSAKVLKAARPQLIAEAIRDELESLALRLCPGDRFPLDPEDTHLLRLALRASEPGASDYDITKFAETNRYVRRPVELLVRGAMPQSVKQWLVGMTPAEIHDVLKRNAMPKSFYPEAWEELRRDWARAVAAFLLFGGFQRDPFPAPQKNALRTGTSGPATAASSAAILKRLYPDDAFEKYEQQAASITAEMMRAQTVTRDEFDRQARELVREREKAMMQGMQQAAAQRAEANMAQTYREAGFELAGWLPAQQPGYDAEKEARIAQRVQQQAQVSGSAYGKQRPQGISRPIHNPADFYAAIKKEMKKR